MGEALRARGSEEEVRRKLVEAVEGSQRVIKADMVSRKCTNCGKCTILKAVDFRVSGCSK